MTKEGEEGEERRGHEEARVSGSLPLSDSEAAAEQSGGVNLLYGLLRDEMAAYGGGEAFLKWLRTDPEPHVDSDEE